jgi:hypothetical protein
MLRHGLRLGVAILTFSIGIAIFWPLKLVGRLENALVDRFYDYDLKPISVSFDPGNEANEIYRLLIHQRFTFNGEAKLIVLRSQTIPFMGFKADTLEPERNPEAFHRMVKGSMPETESQTLDNYLLRNETSEQLKVWNPGINYVLVTNSDLPTSAYDFWGNFYEKFPNSSGIIAFSNVGFNQQQDQALVYVARSCGGLCGSGDFVLLKKINGKWEIANEEGIWVS